jgi:hypothetical protein
LCLAKTTKISPDIAVVFWDQNCSWLRTAVIKKKKKVINNNYFTWYVPFYRCSLLSLEKLNIVKKLTNAEIHYFQDLVKCENKNNATPRTNLKFSDSEHRNSSVKKEKQVCLLICPKLNISIIYIIKWKL